MAAGFLDQLDAELAEQVRRLGTPRSFAEGTALFHERQAPDRVYVLLEGRVKVYCSTEDGREVVLGVREPGDLVGEMSAIDGVPRTASAVALEPVRALVVPAHDFARLARQVPGVALAVLGLVNRRLRDADEKRAEFLAADTVGRMAARLVELVDRFGEAGAAGVRIDLPITHEDLAGWTGSSREATFKALRALRELGWIETRRRDITVVDVDALRRRARV